MHVLSSQPRNHKVGRVAAFLGLSALGAAPIVSIFYGVYSHLPGSVSLIWRGLLGGSFAVGAAAFCGAWSVYLAFGLLMPNEK